MLEHAAGHEESEDREGEKRAEDYRETRFAVGRAVGAALMEPVEHQSGLQKKARDSALDGALSRAVEV